MSPRPAARLGDPVAHPQPPVLTGGPGSPNVRIGGLLAWRGAPIGASAAGSGDQHFCAHGPGVVTTGSATVRINQLPACRQGDTILEASGATNTITGGLPTVLIGG